MLSSTSSGSRWLCCSNTIESANVDVDVDDREGAIFVCLPVRLVFICLFVFFRQQPSSYAATFEFPLSHSPFCVCVFVCLFVRCQPPSSFTATFAIPLPAHSPPFYIFILASPDRAGRTDRQGFCQGQAGLKVKWFLSCLFRSPHVSSGLFGFPFFFFAFCSLCLHTNLL